MTSIGYLMDETLGNQRLSNPFLYLKPFSPVHKERLSIPDLIGSALAVHPAITEIIAFFWSNTDNEINKMFFMTSSNLRNFLNRKQWNLEQ